MRTLECSDRKSRFSSVSSNSGKGLSVSLESGLLAFHIELGISKNKMFTKICNSKSSYSDPHSLNPDSKVFLSAISLDLRAVFEHEKGTSSIPKTGDLTGLNSAIAS